MATGLHPKLFTPLSRNRYSSPPELRPGGRDVLNRRILQSIGVAVIGLAVACAPMTIASAHKAKHPKPKHHASKTTAKKGGSNPTSSICLAVNSAQSSSSNLGVAMEKIFTSGAAGDFGTAKQEMISAMNTALKAEGPALSDLRSAPANVQTAMKGLFTFESNLKTAISNASSITQLATSLESLGQNPQLKTDSLTVANYVTSLCGASTTTTVSIP
jgi:hypothetical protein